MMLTETRYFTCFEPPEPLKLESGQTLGPINLAYETYGQLNSDKSNAVLICHALSGDAHVTGYHKETPDKPGWWQHYVGPQKAIDTDRYFVITSNVIGGCSGSTGPSSINPKTGKPYGTDFPVITIGDMVNAQRALIENLGVKRLALVIGGSMGGMQTMAWAIQYPEVVVRAAVLASPDKLSPQALAFDAVGRYAITTDPAWKQGHYDPNNQPEHGLSVARMIGHITYLSNEAMDKKFGRRLQARTEFAYDFSTEFQIESYLKYQGDKFVHRFDANSYLYITKAISYFDLTQRYGSLDAAFTNTAAKFLLVSFSSDWLYPPEQCKYIAKTLMKLNKPVTYCNIDAPYGHDAFLLENERLSSLISNFLEGQ